LYVFGDVAWEGYKSHAHRKEEPSTVAAVVIERTVFQSLASIFLPMVIIHSQVSLFQKLLANTTSPAIKKWGPTGAGFAIIPFLPLIDEPVEYCLEQAKEKIFGAPSAHPHHHPNPLMHHENEPHHQIEHHKEKHE
jgi:fission process protein 1